MAARRGLGNILGVEQHGHMVAIGFDLYFSRLEARWVPGFSSKQGSTPILLVKLLAMDGEDQVNFLMELFTGLRQIRAELSGASA